MEHISLTPFGRQPMTARLIHSQQLAQAPAPQGSADKWAILRDLTAARVAFCVSDRALAVLAALLSFHPDAELRDGGQLVVHPSNASLCDRAHGMAESTLRRHLSALVKAGLLARRDSPNGKRFAARGSSGQVQAVFGFDLRPLLVRAPEIAAKADDARAAALKLKRTREAVVMLLRDASKLAAWGREEMGGNWDALEDAIRLAQRSTRRRLQLAELEELRETSADLLGQVKARLKVLETQNTHGTDAQNERHYQNSKKDSYESEPCLEEQEVSAVRPTEPPLPLGLVLKAVPEIALYAPDPLRSWHDLIRVADIVRPMIGISPDAFAEAQRIMGPEVAAIVVAYILQRLDTIARPGGYLRSLSAKAAEGAFSPGPMVMSLLRSETSKAA
ncbi:plasmid replication protein RepC [Pararhodobacter oceanensis]|uniref:Replication initiation protein n=1 Tax=Pararhodobacter oceanensis TaxID=2172121 RepID=A0A2T8HPS7_9RHOB|nr:plasmid replication protein RepC [Pararhodobacter oceanensis]PVH27413.1 replication initiation protein [Pararhodobacter oceanensis]